MKVCCVSQAHEKGTRGQSRATGAAKSLQRPDREKRDRQSTGQVERGRQNQSPGREKEDGGQEQEDGGECKGKGELNRRVEAKEPEGEGDS